MSNLHILVQDPENYALLRGTLPSRPNKGVPSFQAPFRKQLQNKEFSMPYITYRSKEKTSISWKIKMKR